MLAVDGPVRDASFIQPDGIAVAADGALYVADGGAQTIRLIRAGRVTTLAGSSTAGAFPDARVGGYRNGPALAALFNEPDGVAVAKDGTIYVADSLNHCIRRLSHGVVSTFAGSTTAGNTDGRGTIARFNLPKAIAIDAAGNLYVADFGVGIREVTPNGVVSTMAVPTDAKAEVYGVSAEGAGSNLRLAYTDRDSIHFVRNGVGTEVRFDGKREPWDEDVTVGRAYAIAIDGVNSVVVTDLVTNSVRFVRFPDSPFIGATSVHILAGGQKEGSTAVGGYLDGTSVRSLVDTPDAIAVAPNGNIFFSDMGNRRIREITGVNPKGPVLVDLSNLTDTSRRYRIALVGNSQMFHNVMWGDSMPGAVESTLEDGGIKSLDVSVVRMDGTGLLAEASFVSGALDSGQVNLVVLVVNPFNYAADMDKNSDLWNNEKWTAVVGDDLKRLRDNLAKSRTRLMIVYLPEAQGVTMSEVVMRSVDIDGFRNTDLPGRFKRTEAIGSLLAPLGIHYLSLVEPLQRFEESKNRYPLFNTRDVHLTPQGATWVGQQIAKDIEKWRPWLQGAR
jgi:streptogramin lyase